MQPEIVQQLLALNHQFYQTFALQFSATRQRLQPGVRRILDGLPGPAKLLDLGCGNGELARDLARRGWQGTYVGLDFSAGLLAEAAPDQPEMPSLVCRFAQADLADPDWAAAVQDYQPDIILAFAVLHHLPGADLQRRVLAQVRRLLLPGGRFIFSTWQFLESQRLCARIQPWQAAGLSESDVEPGDYLLDWRQGGRGLRYVHAFNLPELACLAEQTGFIPLESFSSDGEGGRLGLYQVWGLHGT